MFELVSILISIDKGVSITTTASITAETTTAGPTTPSPPQCEVRDCPSFSSTSVVLASVITAIITALLATVIFVLVLIAVCKCHPKFTPGGAETGTSAGGGECREYEQIDMAVKDHIYMEVGAAEGKTFELELNEAYGTHAGK